MGREGRAKNVDTSILCPSLSPSSYLSSFPTSLLLLLRLFVATVMAVGGWCHTTTITITMTTITITITITTIT